MIWKGRAAAGDPHPAASRKSDAARPAAELDADVEDWDEGLEPGPWQWTQRRAVRLASLAFTCGAFLLCALGLDRKAFIAILVAHAIQLVLRDLLFVGTAKAVARNGAKLRADRRAGSLPRLVRLTTLIDFGTAAVCAGAVLLLLPKAAGLLDWSADGKLLLGISVLIAALNITGTPLGLLQVFGRYGLLLLSLFLVPFLRFAGVLAAVLLDAPFAVYIFVWFGPRILHAVVVFVLGWWQYRVDAPEPMEPLPSDAWRWSPRVLAASMVKYSSKTAGRRTERRYFRIALATAFPMGGSFSARVLRAAGVPPSTARLWLNSRLRPRSGLLRRLLVPQQATPPLRLFGKYFLLLAALLGGTVLCAPLIRTVAGQDAFVLALAGLARVAAITLNAAAWQLVASWQQRRTAAIEGTPQAGSLAA